MDVSSTQHHHHSLDSIGGLMSDRHVCLCKVQHVHVRYPSAVGSDTAQNKSNQVQSSLQSPTSRCRGFPEPHHPLPLPNPWPVAKARASFVITLYLLAHITIAKASKDIIVACTETLAFQCMQNSFVHCSRTTTGKAKPITGRFDQL